jgi:SAM-dependent methyltransferase
MAITRHLAELILAEHKFRQIRGEVLLLGRQLVVMTPDEAQELVAKLGIRQTSNAYIDYDKTPHPFPKRLISDASFFSLFSEAIVKASDVSDYEGADIIFDLSGDVPSSLRGRFDFIYNGSVLDNVFDPAAAIRNISRMLKQDAVVFHYEGAVHSSPAYLKFTPDWFFDYYAINRFADFQAFWVTYRNEHLDPWDLIEWSAFSLDDSTWRLTMPMRHDRGAMVVAIAQNSPDATVDMTPLQNIYRSNQHEAYIAAHRRFADSGRRAAVRSLFPPISAGPPRRSFAESLLPRFVRRREVAADNRPPAGHVYLGRLGSPKFLGEEPTT